MINIMNLIEFLPNYFKVKDTYKVNGKGILERFLEICGNYFVDNIKTPIDNSLDVINLRTTSSQYLSWLSDILGQLPFIKITGVSPLFLTEDQQRDLVKYGNSLIKIRGTQKFFDVIFKLYSNPINKLELVSVEYSNFGWVQSKLSPREYIKRRVGNVETKATQTDPNVLWPYLDVDNLDNDGIRFDEYYSIKQCVEVTFNIKGEFGGSGPTEQVKIPLKTFIERFVPYNVKPIVKLNGEIITEVYSLILEVQKNGKWVSVQNEILNLESGSIFKARVYVVNNTGDKMDNIPFNSSLNGGQAIEMSGIYQFNISSVLKSEDTYKFTLGSDTKTLRVKAVVEIPKTYFIGLNPTTFTQSSVNQQGTCLVTSYYTQGTKKVATSVMCLETGEIKTPISGEYSTGWLFKNPGKYTFLVVGHTSTQAVYDFKPFKLKYSVKLAEAIQDTKTSPLKPGTYTDDLIIKIGSDKIPKVFVKVECNDPSVPNDKLSCFIHGYDISKIYTGLISAPGLGTYTFIPSEAKAGDDSTNANLTVISASLAFSVELHAYETYPKDSEITNEKSSTWAEFRAIPLSPEARDLLDGGLAFMVKLPSGEIIEVPYEQLIKRPSFTMQSGRLDELTITTSDPGTYTVWVKVYPINKVSWVVRDNRHEEVIPEGIMIVPVGSNVGWSGVDTQDTIYQLSPTEIQAKFSIEAYGTLNGKKTIVSLSKYELESSNGKRYNLSTEYIEKDPGEITFRALAIFKDGYTHKEAKLTIKDFDTVIDLRCTPSYSYLINGQAITRLNITSNKPKASLEIVNKDNDDIYVNGSIFTAYEPKIYTFMALVDGKPVMDGSGNPVSCTFEVIDPSVIKVSPARIEFKSDGTPVKEHGNIITIETGESTEWSLEIV